MHCGWRGGASTCNAPCGCIVRVVYYLNSRRVAWQMRSRLLIVLDDVDYPVYHRQLDGVMRAELPHAIHGIRTSHAVARDDTPVGEPMTGAPVEHSVRVYGVRSYFRGVLRFDPLVAMNAVNWLTTPQQILPSLARGCVFHDGLGQLGPIRATLGLNVTSGEQA